MSARAVDLRRGGWARRYPPLISLALAVFIGVAILPSALNVQQSNPSQVAEYAPVPPEDDAPPASDGSMSSLGLGSGGGLSTGLEEAIKQQLQRTPKIKKPQNKRCVEFPDGLKQTNDPNAPPCAPFFDGDNGGATYQGVTGDEITVMVYRSGSINTGSGEETPAAGLYCDVDKAPNTEEGCLDRTSGRQDHHIVRITRALARYFNDRFQTYGRHVHFYIFWTASTATPSSRRADAAANWEHLKPFAVIDQAFFGGYNEIYAEAMVKRRVMVFGSFTALPAEYYSKNAPMIWSFWPDIEHSVDMYVSYVCTKIARDANGQPAKVSFAGDDKMAPEDRMNGKPRRYALMYTTDPQYRGLHRYRELAEAGLRECLPEKGAEIVERVTFPRAGYVIDTHPDAQSYGDPNVAKMQKAGVTTILWLGGMEAQTTVSAKNAGWYPEWVAAGDQLIDTTENARGQDQLVWAHSVTVSNLLREGAPHEVPARQAYRETEPGGSDFDEDVAVVWYRDHFLLFKSIQVAGPYLTPADVDKGQHLIPKVKSSSPYVAACFYDPNDFTCVKDAAEMWWDPEAPDPEGDASAKGCWRMVLDGERYLARTWDFRGQVFARREDPCNFVDGSTFANPYGPLG